MSEHDTGTERVKDVAAVLEGMGLPDKADLLESLAAERDTLRSAMQSAIVLIDDGSPHKAHGVLDAALGAEMGRSAT